MDKVFSFTNELILGIFLIAIFTVATITTLGLSPVIDNRVAADESPVTTSVLGTSDGEIKIISVDPKQQLLMQGENYLYADQLVAPLEKGTYSRQFITVVNQKSSPIHLNASLQLPSKYKDTLLVGIKDKTGNVYNINANVRELTIPANTSQTFDLEYKLSTSLLYDVNLQIKLNTSVVLK